jgi:hypothetical protein
LFSNNISLCFFLNIRRPSFIPIKTTDKIIVLNILICMF